MNDLITIQDARAVRSDALKNREILLETARRLFSEKSVEAVTMSELAEAAGVGKATLYRNFKNGKVELCETLLTEDQRCLQERTFEKLRESFDAVENLRWFLREVLSFEERNHELLLNAGLVDPKTMLTHRAHGWWRQTIHGMLRQIAKKYPQFIPNINYLTDMLYIMLDARSIHFQKMQHGWTSEQIFAGMWSVVSALF